jgi:hypothetical protein
VNDLMDVQCLARTHFKEVNSSFFPAAFEKSSNKSLWINIGLNKRNIITQEFTNHLFNRSIGLELTQENTTSAAIWF